MSVFNLSRRPRRGATLADFGLVVALVVLICVPIVGVLGSSVDDNFSSVTSSFDGNGGSGGSGGSEATVPDADFNATPTSGAMGTAGANLMRPLAVTASRMYDGRFAPGYAADGSIDYSGSNYASWAVSNVVVGDWWQASFGTPVTVDRIVLHDRSSSADNFGSGHIEFSDGSQVTFPTLNEAGPTEVTFTAKSNISTIKIVTDSGAHGNAGLAEVQVYSGASGNLLQSQPSYTYTANRQYNGDYQAAYAANGNTSMSDGAPDVSWATNGCTVGDWWQVTWPSAVSLNRVKLFDRGTANFGYGHLEFSDGSQVSFGQLSDSTPDTVSFDRKDGITTVRVVYDGGCSGNHGLAEVEAYLVPGLTVQFSDASSNMPTGWAWDFGDGETSTEANPLHEYASAGTYNVSLTVSNAAGSDVETKVGYITVNP